MVSFKKKDFSFKKKDFSLAAFGKIAVPEGYFDKGEIKETEKIASLIKKLLKNPIQGKIATPYVISVLPETKSFIKLFSEIRSGEYLKRTISLGLFNFCMENSPPIF